MARAYWVILKLADGTSASRVGWGNVRKTALSSARRSYEREHGKGTVWHASVTRPLTTAEKAAQR